MGMSAGTLDPNDGWHSGDGVISSGVARIWCEGARNQESNFTG